MNQAISPKSFYRFIEFISKLCGGGLTHEKYKQIALDASSAESKEEKEVKSLADSYHYILLNVKQPFSIEIIKKAYYLLTNQIIDDEIANKILECFYININDDPIHRVMYIQRIIHKKQLERRIEFAFIISNLIMLKCNRYPLIPYGHTFEQYKLNIKIDDEDKWIILLSQMEEKPKEINQTEINKDKIIELIKTKLDFIKTKYQVTFLALYGGVVKGFITSSSDVDFLISFDSSLLDFERGQNRGKLKEYLHELLNAEVDFIDFSHVLRSLDISEMENVLALIKNN